MALKQSRMIAILEAAEVLEKTWDETRKICAEFAHPTHPANLNYIQAKELEFSSRETRDYDELKRAFDKLMESLFDSLFITRSRLPVDALLALTAERAHFKATSRRNDRAAQTMRNLRRERRGGAEASNRRATRADFEAWNRGEIDIRGNPIPPDAPPNPHPEYGPHLVDPESGECEICRALEQEKTRKVREEQELNSSEDLL